MMRPLRRAQILHLENSAQWRREIELALADDHEVHSAASLRQAATLFREKEFDLVITDIDLVTDTGQDEQGFRFIDALQKTGILPGNRVIILSAFTFLEERTRRAFRDYDVWDVVPKDKYDPEELRREVTEAIRTPLRHNEYDTAIESAAVEVVTSVVTTLSNAQSVKDIVDSGTQLDKLLQKRPESPLACLLPIVELVRKAGAVHSPDDKHAYYFAALELLDHSHEVRDGEALVAHQDVQVIARKWRQLLQIASQQLLPSAQIRVSLITRSLFQASEATIAIELINMGSSPAKNVCVNILDTQWYSLRHWTRERRIHLLTKDTACRFEFTVQPKAATATARFEIIYDDPTGTGKRLEFADRVEFLPRQGGFIQVYNPYVAGPPIDPIRGGPFIGRLDILDWVEENLRSQTQKSTLVLHGQRRTGKTSALLQIAHGRLGQQLLQRLDRPVYPVFIDLLGLAGYSTDAFVESICSSISRVFHERGLSCPHPDHHACQTSPFLALNRFFDDLNAVVKEGLVLMLLDEFEALEELVTSGRVDAAIFPQLRHQMQHRSYVVFLLAGTHTLEEMSRNYQGIISNLARHQEITFLSENETVELIRNPVPSVVYDDLAIDKLWRITHGHPYFLQLLCHDIISEMNRRAESNNVTIVDVNGAIDRLISSGGQELAYLWDQSLPSEHLVLSAIADLAEMGPQYVTRSEIASHLHNPNLHETDLSAAFEHLTARRVLRPISWPSSPRAEMAYAYSFDLLRSWILHRHPLASVVPPMEN